MKKVIAIKCKKDEVASNGAPILRAVPRQQIKPEAAPEMAPEVSALHGRMTALCQRNNDIAGQMSRIMNMDGDEFDADKAVGLYQRIAVLRGMALVLWQDGCDENLQGVMDASANIAKQAEQMLSDLEERLAPDFAEI